MRRSVFTTGDVAKILQVAPRTVCNMCSKQGLKHFKIGVANRDRRITRVDLLEWMKTHSIPLYLLDEWEENEDGTQRA